VRAAAAALVGVLAVVLPTAAGCTGGDESPTPEPSAATTSPEGGIDEDRAVELATDEVLEVDPDFDPERHMAIPLAGDDSWDVGFLPSDPAAGGPEYHVVLGRDRGEVLGTYLGK
jgi:hypothetical protein